MAPWTRRALMAEHERGRRHGLAGRPVDPALTLSGPGRWCYEHGHHEGAVERFTRDPWRPKAPMTASSRPNRGGRDVA